MDFGRGLFRWAWLIKYSSLLLYEKLMFRWVTFVHDLAKDTNALITLIVEETVFSSVNWRITWISAILPRLVDQLP